MVLSERFKGDLELFSADEKAVILGTLEEGEVSAAFLERLAAARRRTVQRANSDARTDRGRRLLVGARVPWERAERYRKCAAANGISLYRFACQALEREFERLRSQGEGGIM